MKVSIGVVTATRAEYSLLKPIILKMQEVEDFDVKIIVTGAHLSEAYGCTYKEIESDGFQIEKKIDILAEGTGGLFVSKSMGMAMCRFGEYFEEAQLDYLMVLGDRYETLAVCCAAMNARIPILHLYGGETTEGAIDEAIRHAITKMSYLHFTSTDEYRKRVIQLGEAPQRVFCVGAIGIENALRMEKYKKDYLQECTGLSLTVPYGVVTFHPVTLEDSVKGQCQEVLRAIDKLNEYQFIITGANADNGGKEINEMIQNFAKKRENVYFTYSLGGKGYLSALQYASFVMGNSSSGLVEVPSFGIPTINIGDRQRGRLKAESVIDCKPVTADVVKAVTYAMSEEFRNKAKKVVNPYGDGDTSQKIVTILKEKLLGSSVDLKKKFYDIPWSES